MSKIQVSLIEDIPEIEDESNEPDESHEPDEAAGPIEPPAIKPKRIRKKTEPKPEPPPEPPPPPPTPPTQTKPPKNVKLTTCQNCGKELLEKTFKYYHQLKCKSKELVSQQPLMKQADTKPESITVDFGFQRRAVKQDRFSTLMKRAF